MEQNDDDLLEKFSSHLKAINRSPATIHNYTLNTARFLNWLYSQGITSCRVTSWRDIEQYQGWLLKQPRYCVASAETYMRAVRAFCKYLRKMRIISADPSRLVQLPTHPRTLPRNVMSRAEINRLLDTPDTGTHPGILYRTILEVFYGTALRLSELCNLTVSAVNTQRQELRIVKGKGGKDRIQPLSDTVCEWLDIYIQNVRPVIVTDGNETALFVGCCGGRPIHRKVVQKALKRYARKARIKKNVTPHTIRATTATHMLKKGATLPVVKAMLGHELISTTERYTRVVPNDLLRAIRRFHPREKEMTHVS